MTFREQIHQEVHNNYVKFKAMRFDESQRGQIALLRHGEVVEILQDRTEARELGRCRFPDGFFSIQEIMAKPVRIIGELPRCCRRMPLKFSIGGIKPAKIVLRSKTCM